MAVLTDDELKAIAARWDDTPPGPWEITPNLDTREMPGDSRLRDVEAAECDCLVTTAVEPRVAELLVASRSDVPALVAEVRRLRELMVEADMAARFRGSRTCLFCSGVSSTPMVHGPECPAFTEDGSVR